MNQTQVTYQRQEKTAHRFKFYGLNMNKVETAFTGDGEMVMDLGIQMQRWCVDCMDHISGDTKAALRGAI